MHEVMPEFFSYRYQLREGHPLMKLLIFIERIAIRFAHQVITVSDTLKEILIKRGGPPEKITVVMNVADDKIFPTGTAMNKLSKPPQQNAFTMSYHGLLSDIYDLEVLFNALYILKNKIPELRFLVIGHGPREIYYQNLVRRLGIEKYVSFMGHITQEHIPQVLANVELGVVPLKNVEFTHIAFPTKFVEYIALGIPVLVARRRTIERYFDSNCVAFFEADNGKSLAEVILRLYHNPEERCQLVQNALRRYQEIEWSKMKKRYYELMDKIVNSS
jgi:glycosyltransferase involved in cell wall biosynthesis